MFESFHNLGVVPNALHTCAVVGAELCATMHEVHAQSAAETTASSGATCYA